MSILGNPVGRWIMICHADEFWLIDPRQLVQELMVPKKNMSDPNILRVQVLTASPLESVYNQQVQKLSNNDRYLEEQFNIFEISNLTFNDNCTRSNPPYFENRFFRWEEGMKWGDRNGMVVPEHNPKGAVSTKANTILPTRFAFYVHFKMHDFSPRSRGGDGRFTNSKLQTRLQNLTEEGWMGTFLDQSFPAQLNKYPPMPLKSAIEEFCIQHTKPSWPCVLSWTSDARFH